MGGEGREGAEGGRGAASVVAWTVTGFLLALIAGVVLYGITRSAPAPPVPEGRRPAVETLTVRPQPYEEALELPAVLEADRRAAVSPEFGGRLVRWYVEEGGWVDAGQVVARLDTETLESTLAEQDARRRSAWLAVRRAQAATERARLSLEASREELEIARLGGQAAASELELARAEHGRTASLVARKVLDAARLDQARNALRQAEVGEAQARRKVAAAELAVQLSQAAAAEARAALAEARARVEEIDAAAASVRVELGKADLVAPISGRLDAHRFEPGEFVAAGEAVARLYDLRRLRAAVQVPERYVAFLEPDEPNRSRFAALQRPGAVVDVRAEIAVPGLPRLTGEAPPEVTLEAEIARVAQAADPESNTFRVELRAENPDGAVKHGVIGRARIRFLRYPEAIVIPMAAVQVTDEGPRVLVAEESGGRTRVRVRGVEPVSVRGRDVLVLRGLEGGERLIVAGGKGLVEGQPVEVVVHDGAFLGVGGADEP
ncbi:MAG: efflux RND transporter periplasmic adaptor subunit [Deferrisomatales bacterium]